MRSKHFAITFLLYMASLCGVHAQSTTHIPVFSGSRWGYITPAGDTAIPFKYRTAWPFSDGLAVVRTEGKYGYIDTQGQVRVPEKYDYASSFKKGRAIVRRNDECFLIDNTGKELLSFKGTQPILRDGYITYQNPETDYNDIRVITLEGKSLLADAETFFSDIFGEYPFIMVARWPGGQIYLKDKKGNSMARIGRMNHHNHVVGGHLFTQSRTFSHEVNSLDTLRIFDAEARLIKTIVPEQGFRFMDSHVSKHQEYFHITQRSTVNNAHARTDVYDAFGNLKLSYHPLEEEYHFLGNNFILHGSKGKYQIQDAGGHVQLDNILFYSYNDWAKIENPKVLVMLPDSMYALADSAGRLFPLPKKNYSGYSNRDGKVWYMSSLNNYPIAYAYSPHTDNTYAGFGNYFGLPDIYTINDTSGLQFMDRNDRILFHAPFFNASECQGTIYPSPYDVMMYDIFTLQIRAGDSPKKSTTLTISEKPQVQPTFGNCFAYLATFTNNSKRNLTPDVINHVWMEIQNPKGKWIPFNRYLFHDDLRGTVILPTQKIEFPIYNIQGSHSTRMRLRIDIHVSAKKKKAYYSSSFPVGINPDFLLPQFIKSFDDYERWDNHK